MSHHTRRSNLPRLTPLIAAAVLTISTVVQTPIAVRADSFDEQIKALEQKIIEESSKKDVIGNSAANQIKTVDDLILQLANLQAVVGRTSQQKTETEDQLAQLEAEIPVKKQELSEAMRDLSIDKNISPLEIIISSQNLSEVFDELEVKHRIQQAVNDKILALSEQQNQVASKKTEITKLLTEQTSQQRAIDDKKQTASQELGITNEQIAALSGSVNQKTVEVAELREQQAAANNALLAVAAPAELPPAPAVPSQAPTNSNPASPSPPPASSPPADSWMPSRPGMIVTYAPGQSGGGYPSRWATSPQDSLVDSWGMYNRECVSYTAFRVANSGRFMPSNWVGWIGPRSYDYKGNARNWPNNARAIGILVDRSPRVGDVAISDDGYFGHAMYVEAVYANGLIKVSQYNFNVRGEYSEMYIFTSGLQFIHF